MELKMDEMTRLKWIEYSNDSQKTPPCFDILEFLDMQARQFESVSSGKKLQPTTYGSYMVIVEEACVACRTGNHLSGSCSKFQGMEREEAETQLINKGALYKNCLNSGHIASRCHTPPMCKKCGKYHYTLLHIVVDLKTERTKKVSNDVTYTAPSRRDEEVLLMTCQVEVIAPDGSVAQARALKIVQR